MDPGELGDPASFTPADSPLTIADVLASPTHLDLMTPDVTEGGPAVDFSLPRLGSGAIVTASELWARRPVVLIFGSYT